MSLKKNILANYVSQIYVMLIGIAMVPMYVKYMGAEAYGLVGFFTMLQAWFQLLDMGLTPTMARATARSGTGADDPAQVRQLLRALEVVFVGIALAGATVFIVGSGAIATEWLQVESLPLDEVRTAIVLMGVIVALRWVAGLYRGAITGFEKMVWLSGANVAVSTARFVLVIPVFIYFGTTPIIFFIYQLIIAVLELAALVAKTYQLLPPSPSGGTKWSFQPLRGVLKFSLSIAFTSSVWVLVTQTDKLVLSKLLPLAEYGYFTLAVLVAGGVTMAAGPISTALLPRITNIAALGDDAALYRLYGEATQIIAVIAVPASLVLSLFSDQVLWAWTGNADIARSASSVLVLYALGNCVLALASFPYYLQYAKGDLKLHLIGNGVFVTVLIPGLILATLEYGVIGAGYAWLGSNIVYFLFWLPLVHRRFRSGLHTKWLLQDIAGPAVLALIAGLLAKELLVWPTHRGVVALELFAVGLVITAASALGTGRVRSLVGQRLFGGPVRKES